MRQRKPDTYSPSTADGPVDCTRRCAVAPPRDAAGRSTPCRRC